MKYLITNETSTNKNFHFPTISVISTFLKIYIYVNNATLLILDWIKWGKVFKYGLSKICGRLLMNFTWSILEYFIPNIPQIIFDFIAHSIVT